ncbi:MULTISPECIES: hypothetical protein [unclassified Nonomuraea]|uniref:hypothetical protein n=1 Tax=unclassified Nonomuraea TaxID=2593643 RepID=UPI0033F01A75
MATYALGAVARLSTTVQDATSTLTDPSAISLSIQLPDGTVDGPLAPTKDSVGVYRYDYLTAQPGRHVVRWVTTSPTGVSETPFDVAAQWSAAGLVSLADARAHLNITTGADDVELAEVVRAATAAVERHVGAVLRRVYVEEHPGGYAIALHHTPVLSVASASGVLPGVPDLAAADLQVDGSSGVLRRGTGAWIAGPVRVTYTAGRAEVPPNVRLATLIIIQHLWETQRGSALPRFGGEDTWDPRQAFAVPRRALELLGERVSGIA